VYLDGENLTDEQGGFIYRSNKNEITILRRNQVIVIRNHGNHAIWVVSLPVRVLTDLLFFGWLLSVDHLKTNDAGPIL
jgi:hypothetical protein